MQELKNFQAACPHADLEPFLAKSSSYFRKYIERGLASIEPSTATVSGSSLPTVSGSQSDMLSHGTGNHNILSESRGVGGGHGGDGNTPSAFMK